VGVKSSEITYPTIKKCCPIGALLNRSIHINGMAKSVKNVETPEGGRYRKAGIDGQGGVVTPTPAVDGTLPDPSRLDF